MSIHTAPNIPTITTDSELTIPGFRERAQDAQSSVNNQVNRPLHVTRTLKPRALVDAQVQVARSGSRLYRAH